MKRAFLLMLTVALSGCATVEPTVTEIGEPPGAVLDAIATAAALEGWTIEAQTDSVISIREPMTGASMIGGSGVSQLYQARVVPGAEGGSTVTLNVYRMSGAGQIPQGAHTHDAFWEMVRPHL